MKIQIGLILLAPLFLSFFACTKENSPAYEVSMQADTTINLGLNTIETHYYIIRNIPTNYKASADLHNKDTSAIKNVLASKGRLEGFFQSIDFDIISRISIYAVSRKNKNLKREMYYLDQVPLTTDEELRMLSSSTELKEILSEEAIDLEIRLNFRESPGPNLRFKVVFGYAVF